MTPPQHGQGCDVGAAGFSGSEDPDVREDAGPVECSRLGAVPGSPISLRSRSIPALRLGPVRNP